MTRLIGTSIRSADILTAAIVKAVNGKLERRFKSKRDQATKPEVVMEFDLG